MATRAAGAERHADLLSDVAPELAKRWVAREAAQGSVSAPSPNICRGLMSVVLRATSRGDALEAIDVLDATGRLPLEDASTPLERLGFGRRDDRAVFRAVLVDLVEAVISQSPLLQANPALSFYCTAGAGANDDAEYETAQSATNDARNSKRVFAPDLQAVRQYNVVSALSYCASVLADMVGKGASVLEGASRAERVKFWKTLYSGLPANADQLSQEQLRCIVGVYSTIILCEGVEEQGQFVKELHTMYNTLAGRKKSLALSTVARAFASFVPVLGVQATLSCLLESFMDSGGSEIPGAIHQGDVARPLEIGIARFAQHLVAPLLKKKMDERAQAGVPALLIAFSEAWLQAGEDKSFVAVGSGVLPGLINQLKEALERLEAHNTAVVPLDVAMTRVVTITICHRAMLASKRLERVPRE
jgi:hypothetical protein